MKKINILIVILCSMLSVKAQTTGTAFSGSINCTIGDRSWTGNIQTAMYKKQEDYIFLAFESDSARLEVTLRYVKKEIAKNIPYTDMIRGSYTNGVAPDLVFFSRYFPDKKNTNYAKAFTMLQADFSVDALDLTANTVKIAFQEKMGKATRRFNPLRPNTNELEKLDIKNAESSSITFISF